MHVDHTESSQRPPAQIIRSSHLHVGRLSHLCRIITPIKCLSITLHCLKVLSQTGIISKLVMINYYTNNSIMSIS